MADEGLVPTHYSQTSAHHPSLILEQLNVQRYYGAFCDIVLRVEDVDVRLHKCVLAASSARLQSLVYGMRQECGELLSLKDVSLPGFWPILDYIYTGVLKLETTSVQEVLIAAQSLEIRDVEKICLEYVKLIQNGAASCPSGGPGSNIPGSPAPGPEKAPSHGAEGVNSIPNTSANTTGGVPPPPLFTMSSDGALSGQYITPVSPPPPPPQQRDHGDKHLHAAANQSAALLPLPHSHMAKPSAPEIPRVLTPRHHPPPATMPAPVLPPPTPATPNPLPPPHLSFPMPLPPSHLTPHPLPPMLPAPVTSQSHYPASSAPEQPYSIAPGPVPPRGFPGMPIDTNYVEDYLKLIESFQGEPHQVQPFQQPLPLPPPQSLVQQPPSTSRSLTPNTAPHTPQDSSHLPPTPVPPPGPTHEYLPPPGYQPPALPPPLPPQIPTHKPVAKLTQGHLHTESSSVNHMPNSYNISQTMPGNPRGRVFPTSRTSGNPIGQMTAEEVRRTVLNVLSKFDDDEEDSEVTSDAARARGNKVEQVPPLTSFLNFAPLTQSAREGELAERGAMSDGQDLYGNLQIVSSDSDASDADELETDGYGTTPDPYTSHDPSYPTPGLTPEQNTPADPKESLIMRMKKATWPTRKDTQAMNQMDNNNMDNQIMKVDNFEINLELASLGSPPPTDATGTEHAQLPKKRGSRRKTAGPEVALPTADSIFKDTVKDPSMAHRPLKKRIRLRVKKKYQCLKCGREFVRGEALESHVEQHDRCQLLSCHVCSQKFARVSELTRHQREHSAETYRCLECQSEFPSSKQYKLHMDGVHREGKAFYCTFPGCEYRAAKLSNLEKHMPIHADMKRYHCRCCGKNFAQPNGLRSHQKSCRQERGYLCDICGAKFNYLQSMKSHRLLHSGEKPFDCPDCGAKFTDPRNLKRHRRIHENLFPYQCSECDKRFRHSNSLKAHAITHDRRRGPQGATTPNRRPQDSSATKRPQDPSTAERPQPPCALPRLEGGVINIMPQTPRSGQRSQQESAERTVTDPYGTPRTENSEQYRTPQTENSEQYGTPRTENSEQYRTPQTENSEQYRTPQTENSEQYRTPQTENSEQYRTPQTENSEQYGTPRTENSEQYRTPQTENSDQYRTPQTENSDQYRTPQTENSEQYRTPQTENSDQYRTPQTESRKCHNSLGDTQQRPTIRDLTPGGEFCTPENQYPLKYLSPSNHGTAPLGHTANHPHVEKRPGNTPREGDMSEVMGGSLVIALSQE